MLVGLSTLLNRSTRKNAVLLIVPITNLEQTAAALRAAESTNQSIVFLIDATQPLLFSLEITLSLSLQLLSQSPVQAVIIVQTNGTHLAVEQALAARAPAILIKRLGSQAQYVSVLSWASNRLAAHGTELLVYPDWDFPEAFVIELETIKVVGIVLPASYLFKRRQIDPAAVYKLKQLFKLPILTALDFEHTAKQVMSLKKIGVGGVIVNQEFDQAFTAGVRVALRNSTEGRPAYFLGKGGRAVEDKVARYLGVLCTI